MSRVTLEIDDDPANTDNWQLRCAHEKCRLLFDETATVGVMGAHRDAEHPEDESVEIDLVWIGYGVAPPADQAPDLLGTNDA